MLSAGQEVQHAYFQLPRVKLCDDRPIHSDHQRLHSVEFAQSRTGVRFTCSISERLGAWCEHAQFRADAERHGHAKGIHILLISDPQHH